MRFRLTRGTARAYAARPMSNRTLSSQNQLQGGVSSLALIIGVVLIVLTGGGPV